MEFFTCVDLISSFTLVFVMVYIGRCMSLEAPPSPSVKVVYVVAASSEGVTVEEAAEEGLALTLPSEAADDRDWGGEGRVDWPDLFICSLLACLLALTMCMARVSFILYMISKELELQQLTLMHVIENM